jgi:DNA-binding NarL/FixJ family response regulator
MLGLGFETVRRYRKAMMKKLNVNNAAGLIRVALAAGLTSKTQLGASGLP